MTLDVTADAATDATTDAISHGVDRLGRSFYARRADVVARALLGCTLVVGNAAARIVETEAYLGESDAACHARAGRTPRTATMYGEPGTLYVYLVYGLHWLVNVVCADVGEPHAVLLRAAEPLDAAPAARVRADAGSGARRIGRCDGPGRLGKSLGFDGSRDGDTLLAGDLAILPGTPPRRVLVGPRIGVDYAGAWAHAPLRFGDADSRALSRPF